MPEFAAQVPQDYVGAGSISYTTDQQASARIEQVKALDESLSRVELQLERLASRIAPGLRSPEPVALAGQDKAPEPNESDVVAHLRHTRSRVNGIGDQLASLNERIDL